MSRSLSNRRRAQCVSRIGPLRHPSTHERVPPKIASPTTDEHLPRCLRNKVALGIFPPDSPYWTQAHQKLPNCDIEIKGYAELIGAFARYTRCKELAAQVRSICFYDEDPNEIGDNTFSFLLAPHTNGLPGWLPNLERVVMRAPTTRVPMDDVLPQAKWVDVLRVAWTYAGEQGGTLLGGSPKSSKANRPHRRLSRVEITPDIFQPCFNHLNQFKDIEELVLLPAGPQRPPSMRRASEPTPSPEDVLAKFVKYVPRTIIIVVNDPHDSAPDLCSVWRPILEPKGLEYISVRQEPLPEATQATMSQRD